MFAAMSGTFKQGVHVVGLEGSWRVSCLKKTGLATRKVYKQFSIDSDLSNTYIAAYKSGGESLSHVSVYPSEKLRGQSWVVA